MIGEFVASNNLRVRDRYTLNIIACSSIIGTYGVWLAKDRTLEEQGNVSSKRYRDKRRSQQHSVADTKSANHVRASQLTR